MLKKDKLQIYFKDSSNMSEITNKSVDLFISGSLYLGKEWSKYEELFIRLYLDNAFRVLKDTGFLVIQQTDGYKDNKVFQKSHHLINLLLESNKWNLIDHKIWKRCKLNYFQVPYSHFFILTKLDSKIGKYWIQNKEYLQSIWDYPQDKGSQMNSWSYSFCKMLIDSFTKEGDTILDPLAGYSKLLILGSKMNRNCIGYEINKEFKEKIELEYNKLCQDTLLQ